MLKKLSVICLLLLSLSVTAKERNLTPNNHPRNHNYYVCYRDIHTSEQDGWSRYNLYHYQGCFMTLTPCKAFEKPKRHRFGLFKTYPLALNAYYRCAYS